MPRKSCLLLLAIALLAVAPAAEGAIAASSTNWAGYAVLGGGTG